MFENLPPLHRPARNLDSPRQRALDVLGATLMTMPAPWTVLRDRLAASVGSGLGASFAALHPKLGIALIDLAPARPKNAIQSLRALLAGSGKEIFTAREPPIAAVLLARDEIPLAAARVEAALAALPPAPVWDEAWPDAAVALLKAEYAAVSLVTPRRRSASERAAAPSPSQPEREAARGSRRSRRRELSFSPAPFPARAPAESPGATRQEPSLSREAFAPAGPRVDTTRSPSAEERRPGERAEPSLTRGPPPSAEPQRPPRLRLVAERDDIDEHGEGPRLRVHSSRRRRMPALWVVGGSLIAVAAIMLADPRGTREPSAPPGAAVEAPVEPAAPASQAAQASAAPAPQPATAPPQATPPHDMAAERIPPPSPIAPPRAATILPPVANPPQAPPKAETPPPRAEMKTALAPKANRGTEAAAKPEPAAPRASAAPPARREEAAVAAAKPAEPAKPAAPSKAKNSDEGNADEIVRIDGTDYVAGREPHPIGKLAAPGDALASTPTPPPQPNPPVAEEKLRNSLLPPATDFSITPTGIMTPSGVVTPFGQR